MKKWLSIILSCVMCFSFATPSLAGNSTEKVVNTSFVDCGNGLYKPADKCASQVAAVSDGAEVIQAIATEDANIFQYNSNKFLVRSYDENYVMTERHDIDVECYDPLDYQGIPVEVWNVVAEEIEKQKNIGNCDFTVSVYAPTSSNTGLATASDFPTGWGDPYPYGPYQLKDWFVDLNYARTGWLEKNGVEASEWADLLFDIVLSTTLDQIEIPIFQYGRTALEYALEATGILRLTELSDEDCVQEDTIYHKLGKSTYVWDSISEEWLFSLQTSLVTVESINTYSFFAETGETPFERTCSDEEIPSENYNNPQMAIQMLGVGYSDPRIRHTVWGETFLM